MLREMSVITRIVFNSRAYLRRPPSFSSCIFSRDLFSDETLRMDVYKNSREVFRARLRRGPEIFWKRIKELSSCRPYEEDLKMVCFMAEKEHVSLLKDLLIGYLTNNNPRLGGDFRMGPVVMRLCHYHNDPDLALEVFYDKRLQPIFNYQAAMLILMDLLLKNNLYSEVVKCFEDMIELEWIQSVKSRAIALPYTLALYAIGNTESLQKACKFFDEIQRKDLVLRRMPLAIAALALKCNRPEIALKHASRYPSYHISYNIIIQALLLKEDWKKVNIYLTKHAESGLFKDTIQLLSSSLSKCPPTHVERVKRTIQEEVKDNKTLEEHILAPIDFTPQDTDKLQRKRHDHATLLELRSAFRSR